MKKLKLKLDGKEMLSKEQMKSINGGTGNCTISCNFNGTWHGDFGWANCSDFGSDGELGAFCNTLFPFEGFLTEAGCYCE